MKSSTKDNAEGKLHQATEYQMKPTSQSMGYLMAGIAVAVIIGI